MDDFRELVTADPTLQPDGEETQGLSADMRDRMALLPAKLKLEVRRAHHQLGHPSKAVLLRLARMAGKSEDHLWYIKNWQCPYV